MTEENQKKEILIEAAALSFAEIFLAQVDEKNIKDKNKYKLHGESKYKDRN